ncbi:MAG: hypothetical protein U9P12_01330, partial [Verrucomicrobiota bacterium]|nr:hypothetical protein [Verrucomicrobiota bacterium]
MTLVRIVSNDDAAEWIRRGTPGGSGMWGNVRFTAEAVGDCDYCVFHNNNQRRDITVNCPPENI